MKNFISLFLLSLIISFSSYSQTTFYKNGWETGYKEGYCYQKVGCVTPYVPVCPIPNVGKTEYKDGYNRGFLKGKSDNSSNLSNDNIVKKFRPVKTDYGTQIRDHVRRNNELASERRSQTQSIFRNYVQKGFSAFDLKEYEKSISYYNLSKELGWYDANFEHMIAVSYFELWKQTKEPKYKSKVKKMLMLSKKHGSEQAKVDLKKLKELIKKYENKDENVNNVYDGNLIISTQSEIDNFNYTEITGNLRINEYDDNEIKSLKGLHKLTSVGGNFNVSAKALKTLKGLENLKSVRGSFNIMGNKTLISLDGLKNLTSVGSLFIWGNTILTSLKGLENLTSVGDDIKIGYNRALISLCEIKGLIGNEQISESKYSAQNNAYNPTYTQIKSNSGCRQ